MVEFLVGQRRLEFFLEIRDILVLLWDMGIIGVFLFARTTKPNAFSAVAPEYIAKLYACNLRVRLASIARVPQIFMRLLRLFNPEES